MSGVNALRLAFRQRFLSEPHLINALVTGAKVWPPENNSEDELLALANDLIRESTGDGPCAPSSIRLDALHAACEALTEILVSRPS